MPILLSSVRYPQRHTPEEWIIQRTQDVHRPLTLAVHGRKAIEKMVPVLTSLSQRHPELKFWGPQSGIRFIFVLGRGEEWPLTLQVPSDVPLLTEEGLSPLSVETIERQAVNWYRVHLGRKIGVVIKHWVGDGKTWSRYQNRGLHQNTLIVTLMSTPLDDLRNHQDWDEIAPQLILTLNEPARDA